MLRAGITTRVATWRPGLTVGTAVGTAVGSGTIDAGGEPLGSKDGDPEGSPEPTGEGSTPSVGASVGSPEPGSSVTCAGWRTVFGSAYDRIPPVISTTPIAVRRAGRSREPMRRVMARMARES